jgi:hypothetical protein
MRAWLKASGAAIEHEWKPDGSDQGARGPYEWDYTRPEAAALERIAAARARPARPARPPSARPTPKPARVAPRERPIQAEAEQLRRLLEENEPQFATTWRPLRLERGAPAAVRAFWEALGWSELFAGDLAEPSVASGRRAVQALLAAYRADNDGFRLRLADLPRRFRFLSADEQGVGFAITDESRRGADPPIVTVLAEDGRILPDQPSYIRFAAAVALLVALRGWREVARRGPLPPGRRPFPVLVPEARVIDAGRWLVPDPRGGGLLLLVRGGGEAPRRAKVRRRR